MLTECGKKTFSGDVSPIQWLSKTVLMDQKLTFAISSLHKFYLSECNNDQ